MQEIIKLLFNNKPADLNWLSTLKKLVKTEELDLGKAIEYANVLHQELPTYKNIYSRLAYFLTSLNKYEEADSLFCLDAKSGNQTWWGKLRHAECIALSGDMDKALTMVNDVYSASYDAVNGFGHLGWTLLREQRITEAEAAELILKDVSLDRMTIGFKLVAAPIIAFIDKETSIKLVQEAYDANQDLSDGFASIGIALLKINQENDALTLFKKDADANKISVKNSIIYAELLLRNGHISAAEEVIEAAYAQDNSLKDIYSKLFKHVPISNIEQFGLLIERDKKRGFSTGFYDTLDAKRQSEWYKYLLRNQSPDTEIPDRHYLKKTNILLINTSFPIHERKYSDFGPPLGILSISSSLQKHGYEVIFIDPQIEDNYEEMIENALKEDILFVGMSTYMGENLKNCLKLTEQIKRIVPQVPIVFGGPLASSLPEVCFKESSVDYIVMGAGEITVIQLADCLLEGKVSQIHENLYISSRLDSGEIKIGKPYSFSGSINELPLIDLTQWEKGINKLKHIPLITSRGCPYKCTFCYNTFNENGKFFLRTAESVIEEMDNASEYFSCKNFFFMDDNFLINEERALTILAHAQQKGYRINRVYGHLNTFTPEIQKAIIKAKIGVTMCIESGSPKIRKILKKHINTEKALTLIKNFTDNSINFITAFMFGIPNEEMEDIELSAKLAIEIDKISNGKAISMFYLYCPQPKDGIVESLRKIYDINFTLSDMSDVEVVPVPPNDVVNLRIRPWMTKEMSTFYISLAQVWLYHFNKKAQKVESSFSLETIYKKYPDIKRLFV